MTIKSLRRLVQGRDGGALVELAVSLPILVAILAGTVDFARVFNMSIALTNAARAGAQYGADSLANSNDTTSTGPIVTTAKAATNLTGVGATASRDCVCVQQDGSSPTVAVCTSTCTSPKHMVMTVTVTTSKRFTTLMSVLPGVPSWIDLSRSATLRVVN